MALQAGARALQTVAMNGHTRRSTKKIGNSDSPFCAACKYGKQTKRQWCTKGLQGHIRTTTQPGKVVSVDQLESPRQDSWLNSKDC